jgi:HEAT repeat protein
MVRGGAARALAAIGPDAALAVGPLVAALAVEKDRDVVVGIIDACGEIGPRAIQAAPAIVAVLASPDAETREAAVAALGEIGPEAASTAAAAVERLLDDKDAFVRVAAVGSLAGLGRPAARGRRVLLDALAAADEDLQTAAAEVVADLGRAATGFSTALAKVARTAKDARARRAAVTALGDIGGTDQAAVLGLALEDPDADVRHAAAWAIADLPEIVVGLGREIVAAADDDDVRVRMEIAPLLAAVGTPEAVRALAELRADDDPNVAEIAKQAASAAAGTTGSIH